MKLCELGCIIAYFTELLMDYSQPIIFVEILFLSYDWPRQMLAGLRIEFSVHKVRHIQPLLGLHWVVKIHRTIILRHTRVSPSTSRETLHDPTL